MASKRTRAVVVSAACSLALGCGGIPGGSGFLNGGDGAGGSGGNVSGSGGTGTSSSGAGSSGGIGGFGGDGGAGSGSSRGGGNGCTGEAANFVYVLSAENDLYSFAPDKKLFTKIGTLGCKTTMQPNSMAVDRNAVAWVNYVQTDVLAGNDSAGVIYQVSTHDASCQPAPAITLPQGWYRLGMGYSTNGGAGATSETLFVAGTGNAPGTIGTGLGTIDFTQKALKSIGMFTGTLAGQNGELTGTGDGRLYGFFTTTPVEVAQIEKTTGATRAPVPMTGVMTPNAWAFSFWGGHFYLYTSQGQGIGNGSDVTDYDPVSGSINPAYMTSIGFDIVGAGVSTCAPVTAPQ
jgi:hypothetical protein